MTPQKKPRPEGQGKWRNPPTHGRPGQPSLSTPRSLKPVFCRADGPVQASGSTSYRPHLSPRATQRAMDHGWTFHAGARGGGLSSTPPDIPRSGTDARSTRHGRAARIPSMGSPGIRHGAQSCRHASRASRSRSRSASLHRSGQPS